MTTPGLVTNREHHDARVKALRDAADRHAAAVRAEEEAREVLRRMIVEEHTQPRILEVSEIAEAAHISLASLYRILGKG